MRPGAIARVVSGFAGAWPRRPPTPIRAVLAATYRCNMRCAMCRAHQGADKGTEMTAAQIGRLCAALPRLCWLDVTGGEIFLRADIREVISAILENTPRLGVLHFPTNGWFPDRAVALCEQIRSARPDVDLLVTVSVDGPPDLHDRLRGKPGAFARAVVTYEGLESMEGVGAFIGSTLTAENQAMMPRTEAHLRERLRGFGARRWHWNLYQVSSHFFRNEGRTALGVTDAPELVLDRIARRGLPRSPVDLMEQMFLVNLRAYCRGERLGFPCQALRSTCFVAPDGTLYPCHVYDRPIANVVEEAFEVEKLWGLAGTAAAREDVVRGACGGCFTPCEAYPAIAGSPIRSTLLSAARAALLAVRGSH